MTRQQEFLNGLIHLLEDAEREGLTEAQRLLLPVVEALAPVLALPRPVPQPAPAAPREKPADAAVVQLDDYRTRRAPALT